MKLRELYEVIASPMNCMDSELCPVLLKCGPNYDEYIETVIGVHKNEQFGDNGVDEDEFGS